ncbi:hypothetical protein KR009_003792 [Drosophila setifemur]|nr:hypothetical protein KR009_003792 [Drosophila setifemur]
MTLPVFYDQPMMYPNPQQQQLQLLQQQQFQQQLQQQQQQQRHPPMTMPPTYPVMTQHQKPQQRQGPQQYYYGHPSQRQMSARYNTQPWYQSQNPTYGNFNYWYGTPQGVNPAEHRTLNPDLTGIIPKSFHRQQSAAQIQSMNASPPLMRPEMNDIAQIQAAPVQRRPEAGGWAETPPEYGMSSNNQIDGLSPSLENRFSDSEQDLSIYHSKPAQPISPGYQFLVRNQEPWKLEKKNKEARKRRKKNKFLADELYPNMDSESNSFLQRLGLFLHLRKKSNDQHNIPAFGDFRQELPYPQPMYRGYKRPVFVPMN